MELSSLMLGVHVKLQKLKNREPGRVSLVPLQVPRGLKLKREMGFLFLS